MKDTFGVAVTITDASLGGGYSDIGPFKTVIKVNAGTLTFNVTKPITATVTSTPKTPLKASRR